MASWISVSWQQIKKWLPTAYIELNIPSRWYGNIFSPNYTYWESYDNAIHVWLDTTMELRVSVIPSNPEIFKLNPTLFLFRYTNRKNRSDKFRVNGKKFVHPTHRVWSSTIQKQHRYWWWDYSNPYAILDRVTEVPLNINYHSITGKPEFYWGSDISIDWTIFPFNPLAWYSYSKDISAAWITFPLPLNQEVTWKFDSHIWLTTWYVQSNAGTPSIPFFPTGKWRRMRNSLKNEYWIALMVDNPDYQWLSDTQNSRKIMISNMVKFEQTFKISTMHDNISWFNWKYAVDWRINLI